MPKLSVYLALLTMLCGYTGADSLFLTERCPTRLYVPTAFSPDGDGVNDTFGPYATDVLTLRLQIFDRWGELVFQAEDGQTHRDGTWRGRPAPVGVYVWMIELRGYRPDGKEYSEVRAGDVVLVR